MARIRYQEAVGPEVRRGRSPVGPMPSKADVNAKDKDGWMPLQEAAFMGHKDRVARIEELTAAEARTK